MSHKQIKKRKATIRVFLAKEEGDFTGKLLEEYEIEHNTNADTLCKRELAKVKRRMTIMVYTN